MSAAPKANRFRRAVAVVLAGVVVGLLLAEAVVRLGGFDWRYARRLVAYHRESENVHAPNADPHLRYRLRPGARERMEGRGVPVTINSLGYRSPERSAEKRPGLYRIVCAGGSNVYGANVADGETWPAQLERALREQTGRDVEVWNAGTSAFVGRQMAIILDEAVCDLDPDLAIIALSNLGQPPFLERDPIEPYFERHPELWREHVPPAYLGEPGSSCGPLRAWLFAHVRFYRLGVLAALDRFGGGGAYAHDVQEDANVEAIRDFVRSQTGRRSVVFFLYPGYRDELRFFKRYYEGTNAPVLKLDADGFPAAYREIHPSPEVLAWYGDQIADWLIAGGIAPGQGESLDAAVRLRIE